MPIPFLAPILTATVGSAVAFCLRIFATIFLVKLFLVTLFVTVLPLALYKLWLIIQGWILTEMMERDDGVWYEIEEGDLVNVVMAEKKNASREA